MRIGLSMLTLVPGISGGSETYARGLAGALAQRGRLDVTAFVPTVAPDAGEGLPAEVVSEYRAGHGGAARAWALARATAFPAPLRRRYAELDVVHFPFTVPVPRVTARTVVTLHDVQHLDLPALFGAPSHAPATASRDARSEAPFEDRSVARLQFPLRDLHATSSMSSGAVTARG